ncbi:flap endonuclease GEN-like 1 [Iris pallida]|uniref:Flap endonuclease GEN-like 1 n=1 Tax=Iris pallida TaxID=29817 RepID=A0AAX6G1E9_IRIPA|nr:flap endonuclease GEN-like 1 [Iris pallida]
MYLWRRHGFWAERRMEAAAALVSSGGRRSAHRRPHGGGISQAASSTHGGVRLRRSSPVEGTTATKLGLCAGLWWTQKGEPHGGCHVWEALRSSPVRGATEEGDLGCSRRGDPRVI